MELLFIFLFDINLKPMDQLNNLHLLFEGFHLLFVENWLFFKPDGENIFCCNLIKKQQN